MPKQWNCVGLGLCAYDYLAVVERYPDRNQKTDAVAFSQQGGGPVATAMATMGRLGMPDLAFIGKIGDDFEGKAIRNALEADHVDTRHLTEMKDVSSAKAFVWIEKKTGFRSVVLFRQKELAISVEEIPVAPLKSTGFLLIDGRDGPASLKAAEIARSAGAKIVMDAGSIRPNMDAYFKMVHYFVCSKDFVYSYNSKASVETILQEIHKKGCSVVVATLGEEGSIGYDGNSFWYQPAFEVDVSDTTGAGDVFHGAFVFGVWKGWPLQRTLQFANAVAAIKCQTLGGRAGIPTYDAAMKFLRTRCPADWRS